MASVSKGYAAGVRVRPLAAEDLDEADRIYRVAFGTFVGLSRPETFFSDAGPGYRTSDSFVIKEWRQAWRW
jgi:hypothetical protein